MRKDKFYKNPCTGTVQTGMDWRNDLKANLTLCGVSVENESGLSFLNAVLVEVKWIEGEWIDQR
ncbi:hypothetical protein LCGC14_1873380 [marine sediment metagenome]|uniref:Uncharacterized protein n=1 Tax=marine sediment metagenome TaxID=412755 RepID=A0A0F9IIC5_9ZZZZ